MRKMDAGRAKARSTCSPDMKQMVGAGVSSGRKSTPMPKFAAGGAAKVRRGVATPAGKPKKA